MSGFDIEQALIEWLPGKLGVPCFDDPPDDKPAEFVTVERTGGETSLGVDRPLVAVQAWAGTRANASALAASARAALVNDSWEIAEVCRCAVSSTYNFPDPDSRKARYQLDVEMVTRP